MKTLHTEIQIKASPQRIWEILTDFEVYPQWNPFIKKISGELKVRKRLRVTIQPPGMKSSKFIPRVTSHQKYQRFSWLGHLLIIGLFDGHHIFEIEENGDGSVRFIQKEEFSGLLVPLFRKMLDTKVRAGFEEMNKALKNKAESQTN